MELPTLLLVIALICFVIAAVGFTVRRINLMALGLAFATASVLAGSRDTTIQAIMTSDQATSAATGSNMSGFSIKAPPPSRCRDGAGKLRACKG